MIHIQKMKDQDWKDIVRIYQEGIQTGMATFEQQVPSWNKWDADHLKHCRLVARRGHQIIGWAALSPVSSRCVYGGVAEVSVYVAQSARGSGVGEILLKELVAQSEQQGLWTLQSGIFPENIASLKLHEKIGFRKIGYREKIAQLDGVWKDNILMEKRSRTQGL